MLDDYRAPRFSHHQHLELVADPVQRGLDVGEGEIAALVVAVTTRRDLPDRPAIAPHRFRAQRIALHRVGRGLIELQISEHPTLGGFKRSRGALEAAIACKARHVALGNGDFIGDFRTGTIRLFHAHRIQRGGTDVHHALAHGAHTRDTRDCNRLARQPAETGVIECRVGAFGKNPARRRTSQHDDAEILGNIGKGYGLIAAEFLLHPVQQCRFTNRRVDQVVMIVAQLDDGGFTLDAPVLHDQVSQRNATSFLRHLVRLDAIEEDLGVNSANFDLGKSSEVGDAGVRTHAAHLVSDNVEKRATSKTLDMLLLDPV